MTLTQKRPYNIYKKWKECLLNILGELHGMWAG